MHRSSAGRTAAEGDNRASHRPALSPWGPLFHVRAYKSGNLDELIVSKVLDELASYSIDPTQIPGLHTDENATICPDGGVGPDAGPTEAGAAE